MFFTLAGVLVTVIVCAVMPHVNRTPYASNTFVWRTWTNETGYKSEGFVFLASMLNAVYSVGVPDCLTQVAEEIPQPSKNVLKAIKTQMVFGLTTALIYLIIIFYAIHDPPAVLAAETFPLIEIYHQATGSQGGALGLIILVFIHTFVSAMGGIIIAGRMYWTLSRDNATPFSRTFARVSPRFRNPFNATLLIGVIFTVFACIYMGSTTAFNAFVGSFVILMTLSYCTAILPHLLFRRANVVPGWFWMSGLTEYVVNAISVTYIFVFIVIFSFPTKILTNARSMNYASLIAGGG